jgi:hypothetical protein
MGNSVSRIRWADRLDLPAIEGMFRTLGFEYQLPVIFAPEGFQLGKGEPSPARNTVVRVVSADEENRPRMVIIGRRVLEAYFLIDHGWLTPAERYDRFLELHNAACESGRQIGYEQVVAMLPDDVEKPFGKRLTPLGWGRNLWQTYSREL